MQNILASDPGTLERLQWKCDEKFFSLVAPEFYHGYRYPLFPIHDAARMGHMNCVKFMVESGASINKISPICEHGINVLHFANTFCVVTKSFDLLKYLIEIGANPNIMYQNKIIADLIELPAENGFNEFLKFLLENECVPEDLEVTEDFKLRPLLIPTIDHLKPSKCITGEMLPPEPRTSALTKGLREGNVEAFRLLLFYGASNVIYFYTTTVDDDKSMTFYSIPHFILQALMDIPDITTEDMMYAFMVYQMFGGNMWTTMNKDANLWVTEEDPSPEVRCTETALTYLRRKPAIKTCFPGLEEGLEKMMEGPISLKALSRVAVRKAMGRHMWRNISKLDIPQELSHYLHFPVDKYIFTKRYWDE